MKREFVEKEKRKKENIDAIYIHIPFCSKKCEYCDFCTYTNMEKEFEKYVDYLIKEIRMYPKYNYDTIYFGGGTPSLLSVEMIEKIMSELNFGKNTEITLELNPTHITFEKLEKLKKIGINRLSIGIQSFQNKILKFIGREHNSDDAIKVFEMARKVGFNNITVDLMFGIPNQTLIDLQKDLEIIKNLKPENVSIYSLIWEEGTIFWKKLQKGILSEMEEDLEAQMYEKIIDFFETNGYSQYEISNFSRVDDKQIFQKSNTNLFLNFEDLQNLQKNGGRHNLKYWRNQEFIGVGMSAASFYGNNRHSNVRTFKKYYEYLDNEKLPIDENTIEKIDEIELKKLKNMLGLRLTKEGIKFDKNNENIEKLLEDGLIQKFVLEKKYEKNFNKTFLKNSKKNEINSDKYWEKRIKLTKKGCLLANNVFVEFI